MKMAMYVTGRFYIREISKSSETNHLVWLTVKNDMTHEYHSIVSGEDRERASFFEHMDMGKGILFVIVVPNKCFAT